MSREAMQMALEALESDNPDIQLRAAIALRQALEEKQEPVAWLDAEMSQAYTIDELPDASGTGFLPLYTAPPKREWVGLTDGEIDILSCEMVKGYKSVNWLCKALETKLKEKNHG